MPEGPQMVFLKEQLEHFIGQHLLQASGNAKDIPFAKIKGNKLTSIQTFGKEIFFQFGQFTVRIHLMLFGKVAIDSELDRALRLGLEFENGEVNFYACECKFISVPLDEVYDWTTDVMNPAFEPGVAVEKLQNKPKELVCEALLDQHILAGVGNKIKNEVLFRRHVHPESLVGEIPADVLGNLVDESVKLSAEYLEWKREGIENEHWLVYKKEECPRDHVPLRKEKIGRSKRTCYFCDRCQHLYLPFNL
jgi:endonuclease-8